MKPKYFLDIGANIGAYSSIFFKFTTVENIIAFEPSPATYQEMNENFRKQGFSVVEAYNIALSDKCGKIGFLEVAPLAGHNAVAATATHNEKIKAGSERTTVECATLDSIINVANESVIIKLDVEGHEAEVLRGAEAFISRNHCLIQVEILNEEKYQECSELLNKYGYREVLFLHNDYYFAPKEDEELRAKLRDFSYVTTSKLIDEYLAMTKYAGGLAGQIKKFLELHPEHKNSFPRINFPSPRNLFEK